MLTDFAGDQNQIQCIYIYISISVFVCFSCLAKPSCRSYHLCDAISILACFVGNFIVDTPVIRIFHWILSIKHFCSTLLRVVFCTNLQGFLWVTSVAQYNSSTLDNSYAFLLFGRSGLFLLALRVNNILQILYIA